MVEFLESRAAEIVILAAILAILVAVAIYVVGKIRAETVQKEPPASEMMSKFHDLHSKGDLSDTEFRTIKTTLAAQLEEELKDNGETGCDE